MTRLELLETASSRLTEAAILLLVGGEDRLSTEVEEITERVDFSALVRPLEAPRSAIGHSDHAFGKRRGSFLGQCCDRSTTRSLLLSPVYSGIKEVLRAPHKERFAS